MGSCFSCRSSPKIKNIIRVVHLNGYVQDFDYPVSVSQVLTGKLASKHFVCTATQLLSTGSKPLNPETQLEAGKIYFLLPYSTLQADVSPVDFAALVRKLTSVAKSSRCQGTKSKTTSPLFRKHGCNSVPARCPNQRSYGGTPWKPLLDTIREKSFNRSESGLQEK